MKQNVLAYIAIVLVAVAASYGVARSLNNSQNAQNVRACQSENTLKRELNSRLNVSRVTQRVMLAFTLSAAQARYSTYLQSKSKTDWLAAKQYLGYHRDLEKIQYTYLTAQNCRSYG